MTNRRLRAACVATVVALAGAAPLPEFDAAQTARLPPPLAGFTGEDALRAVFPSYRRGRSAVSEIENDDGSGPAHVGFAEAKRWVDGSRAYVVMRFEIGTTEAYGVTLCFPCLEENGLAVLDDHDGRPRAIASNYGNNATADLTVAGVDSVALDLAPYRFDRRRTMIGVRQTHTSGPGAYSEEWLSLFLMRGSKLAFVGRLALATIAVEPDEGESLDREDAVVSIAPRGDGEPNDLIVRSRRSHCPHDPKSVDPFVCDATRPSTVLRAWSARRYRFSSGRYRLVGPALPSR